VVEDERLLRDLAQTVLVRMGYHVLTAIDGLDAEAVLREYGPRIDLVVMDMIMPRRSGLETFHALRRLQPELRILLVSGFSRDERVQELLAGGAIGFLQKPYTQEELARAVATALTRTIRR
jgi:two-component system cell cycle sensor histidine kinase/response regulator CckA